VAFQEQRKSFSASKRDELSYGLFPHEVASLERVKVDETLADENIIFYTDQVTMDDGIRYYVTTNTIEHTHELEKDPAQRQFAGSDIISIEPTAWTTKDGKFYRDRHIHQARHFHRPSMLVGVQRNINRYNSLPRTMNDMLAIYAFYSAVYGYDQENATTVGISRGGMGAILLALYGERYGINVAHLNSMVPCVPDASNVVPLALGLKKMATNEFQAAKELDMKIDELLELRNTVDGSKTGIIQQAKEGVALLSSNIGKKVKKNTNKTLVGNVTVQQGDFMSFSHKWEGIFKGYDNVNVDVIPGGGHASSIGKKFFERAYVSHEASLSSVLHADPAHRKLGGKAFRQLLHEEAERQKNTVRPIAV
jgi:hypothetical protein